MSDKKWYAAKVRVPHAACEAIAYGLMEAGALGTETTDLTEGNLITGYFDHAVSIDTVRAQLLDALRAYNSAEAQVPDIEVQEFADRDWLAEWKKNWRPVEVGRFIVTPPWIEATEAIAKFDARTVIKINPGMAFGTGTHETTRLCLQAIDKYFRGGSFLDVGTGTGVLAIAAARMFSTARVEACDTDAEAVLIAEENARLNEVAGQIKFRVGSINEQTASADLVCANLTAPMIVELLPALLGATCGRLVLSGILDSQSDLVSSRLFELGSTVLETGQAGEWIAMVV